MRKLFFGIGVVAVAFVFLVVAGFGYLAYKGSGLDTESKSYANAAVLAITSHWDAQELSKRASPKLSRSITPEQIASMFEWFAVLSPLNQSQDCKGSSSVVAMIGKPTNTFAQYSCVEMYEHGSATVVIALVKERDVWMVNGFHVNSPFLMAHKPIQKL